MIPFDFDSEPGLVRAVNLHTGHQALFGSRTEVVVIRRGVINLYDRCLSDHNQQELADAALAAGVTIPCS